MHLASSGNRSEYSPEDDACLIVLDDDSVDDGQATGDAWWCAAPSPVDQEVVMSTSPTGEVLVISIFPVRRLFGAERAPTFGLAYDERLDVVIVELVGTWPWTPALRLDCPREDDGPRALLDFDEANHFLGISIPEATRLLRPSVIAAARRV